MIAGAIDCQKGGAHITCMHTHSHTLTRTKNAHINAHTYKHTCTHTHTYTHVHAHALTHTHTKRINSCSHTHTQAHTHTRTHTHTHAQATDMARYMVSECGMNDVVGPMYVSEGDSRHNVLSETVKERIDAQVCVGVRAGVGVCQGQM